MKTGTYHFKAHSASSESSVRVKKGSAEDPLSSARNFQACRHYRTLSRLVTSHAFLGYMGSFFLIRPFSKSGSQIPPYFLYFCLTKFKGENGSRNYYKTVIDKTLLFGMLLGVEHYILNFLCFDIFTRGGYRPKIDNFLCFDSIVPPISYP